MATIKLSLKEWSNIRDILKNEYADVPAVLLIRSVMRSTLGFTVRVHHYFKIDNNLRKKYVEEIHLDFYDNQSETLFRLKYL